MKKVDKEKVEKMAKEKNIDKDKIEKIAEGYKGKSENELMDELVKIGQTLQGREEVVSKFKTFLDEDQRKKLDLIMNKISDAEIQTKLENKKSKQKKSSSNTKPSNQPEKTGKNPKPTKNSSSVNEKTPTATPNKKIKKVVKKIKRSNQDQ